MVAASVDLMVESKVETLVVLLAEKSVAKMASN